MTKFWYRWEGCVWAESRCCVGSTWSMQYNIDASHQNRICSGTEENQSKSWSTRQLQDLPDAQWDTARCPTFKNANSSDSSSNMCRWFSAKKSTDLICTDLRVCFFGWTTDCWLTEKSRWSLKWIYISVHTSQRTQCSSNIKPSK